MVPRKKEVPVPTFVVLAQFTDQGIRAATDSPKRADAFKAMAKKAGANVKEFFWTLGSYDMVAVFENWRASLKWQRLKPYEKFAEMIDRHWDGIAAYRSEQPSLTVTRNSELCNGTGTRARHVRICPFAGFALPMRSINWADLWKYCRSSDAIACGFSVRRIFCSPLQHMSTEALACFIRRGILEGLS
jgi:GYD domain